MIRHLLRPFGILLAIVASAYFVMHAYRALDGQNIAALLDAQVLLSTAALSLLYALLIPTTGMAWTWLLRSLGQDAKSSRLIAILATTQFGKYLPGNVAQHIGRIGLARAYGVALPATVFSMAYETLLTAVACGHISALALILAPPSYLSTWPLAHYRVPLLIAISIAAVLVLLIVPHLSLRIAHYRATQRGQHDYVPPKLRLDWFSIGKCYATYLINFMLVGAGLWLVARVLPDSGTTTPSVAFLTGAFACSWILGFLAPGAPAGLGIREAMLSQWLVGSMPAASIVVLILLLRVSTTLGDLLNFIWGSIAIGRWRRRDVSAGS